MGLRGETIQALLLAERNGNITGEETALLEQGRAAGLVPPAASGSNEMRLLRRGPVDPAAPPPDLSRYTAPAPPEAGEPAPGEPGVPKPAVSRPELTRLPFLPRDPMTAATDLALSYTPESVKRMGAESGLSTAGSLAGAGVGGAFLGPVGALGGEMLGGVAGETLSQALGISPPSLGQIAMAGAAGPVVRGVVKGGTALVRGIGRHWPGVAPVMHEIAKETVEKIPAAVHPPSPAEEEALWKPLRLLNPKMLMSEFSREVDAALREATRGLKGSVPAGSHIRRLQQFQKELADFGDDVPFRKINISRSQIGAWVRSGDEVLRNLGSRLYGPIMRDFEKNAALGGVPQRVKELLDPAIKGTYAAITAGKLKDVIEDGLKTSGKTGELKVYAGRIIDDILRDKDIAKRLSPTELDEIKGLLGKITGLPAELPPGGVQFGSGPSVKWGAAGGALGEWLGLGTMGGVAAGATAPVLLSKLVAVPWGRAALRRAIEMEGGELTPRALMIAAQALRGEAPIPPEGPVQIGPVKIGTRAKLAAPYAPRR